MRDMIMAHAGPTFPKNATIRCKHRYTTSTKGGMVCKYIPRPGDQKAAWQFHHFLVGSRFFSLLGKISLVCCGTVVRNGDYSMWTVTLRSFLFRSQGQVLRL